MYATKKEIQEIITDKRKQAFCLISKNGISIKSNKLFDEIESLEDMLNNYEKFMEGKSNEN